MRLLALYAVLGGLSACYSPQTVSATHAVEVWRAAQSEAPSPERRPVVGSSEVSFTASEAVSRALEVHPEIRVAQARVLSARTHAGALSPVPAVEVRLTELHLDEIVDGQRRLDLGLRIRPEVPGLIETERSRATEEITIEEARRERLKIAVRARVRALHGGVLIATRRLEILTERSDLLENARRHSEAAAAHGATTHLERSLARLAAVDARDEVREANTDLLTLRGHLKRLLVIGPQQHLSLAGPPGGIESFLQAPPPHEIALEEALTSRPETRERAARLAQAHGDVWSEQLKRLPWLSFAQASREINPKSDALSWGFALGVDVPIERWFGDSVEARRADLEVRRQEERAAILAIAGQVSEARERVESALTRYEEVTRLIVPAIEAAQATSQATATQQGLDANKSLRLELSRLSSQRRVLDAEESVMEAQLHMHSVLARP
jgi:outer membrane protein TolC